MEWIIGVLIIAAVVGLYFVMRRRKVYNSTGHAPRKSDDDQPGWRQ